MPDLDGIFNQLKEILVKYNLSLISMDETINSQAKEKKNAYHLYGSLEVSLFGKKPQLTYIAGIIQHKNFISFYFMPIYSHPDDFNWLSPTLKKFLKGKSCFNFPLMTNELLSELELALVKGIAKYRDLQWI